MTKFVPAAPRPALGTTFPSINTTLPFETFDPDKEEFKEFIERFEAFMARKKIPTDDKNLTQTFLTSLGIIGFRVLVPVLYPNHPREFHYKELLPILHGHFHPVKNEVNTLHNFLLLKQKDNQTITDYANDVKSYLAKNNLNPNCKGCRRNHCNSLISNIMLRTQFIRGIKDTIIQEQILKSGCTSFDEIQRMALRLESMRNMSGTGPRKIIH